jgi:hypothetical protein
MLGEVLRFCGEGSEFPRMRIEEGLLTIAGDN